MTDEIADWYRSLSVSSSIHVIPNLSSSKPRATTATSRPFQRVLAVGSLLEIKGFDVLIRGFASIAADFPDIQLRIIGEGPERRSLEALVEGLHIRGRVQLPGHVEGLEDEYLQADAFVLSSRSEGYANVLTEAWTYGLPVVASDCGGSIRSRLRDRGNCLAVPAEDPTAIGDGLRELIKDSGLRQRLAAEALRSTAENHPDHVFELWQAAISDARHPNRRPQPC